MLSSTNLVIISLIYRKDFIIVPISELLKDLCSSSRDVERNI